VSFVLQIIRVEKALDLRLLERQNYVARFARLFSNTETFQKPNFGPLEGTENMYLLPLDKEIANHVKLQVNKYPRDALAKLRQAIRDYIDVEADEDGLTLGGFVRMNTTSMKRLELQRAIRKSEALFVLRRRQGLSTHELTTMEDLPRNPPNSRSRIPNNRNRNWNSNSNSRSSKINYKIHRNHNLNVG